MQSMIISLELVIFSSLHSLRDKVYVILLIFVVFPVVSSTKYCRRLIFLTDLVESAPIKIFFLICLEELIYYFGGFWLTFGNKLIHENHIYAFKNC